MRSKPRHPLVAVSAFLISVSATALAAAAMAQIPSVGLSSVRSQGFGNENLLGFYTPQAGDQFAYSLATGDFNGDGADDLATGLPFDAGLTDYPIADSGSVVVRYGIPGQGLATSLAGAVLRQTSAVNPPEEGDGFGSSLVSCDFNGDGFDDLAVGIPDEDHVDRENTGGVQIHFGGTNGLPTSGQQFYAQSTPGMPGDAEEFDAFGMTLTCGDFNADGFDDLVIGVPHEKLGSWEHAAGMVDIVPGTASGLDPGAATYLTQNVEGMVGSGESLDLFGMGLATGDFNGDGFDDLAIGSPGEDDLQGAIHVVFGGRTGLAPADSLFFMEAFLGGLADEADNFGFDLAAADFDGDGFDDLAIGIPTSEARPTFGAVHSGEVCVLHGAPVTGFDLNRNQFWSEDVIWAAIASEPGDYFGLELAVGDFDRDGRGDLVVAHPREAVSGPDDGAATVLVGSPTGLTNARARNLVAGVVGIPGDAAQHGKYFAESLAVGDFDGDGHADLALGTPREDVDGIINVGTETVLYGVLFADGVENGDTSFWSSTLASPGSSIEVTKAAALGPSTSKVGLEVKPGLFSRTFPASAYVRVGPDRGFDAERTLKGTFFIDPQHVNMNNLDAFRMMGFDDGIGAGSKPRLTFDLHRNDALGGWAVAVSSWNDNAGSGGSLQFVNAVAFAGIGDPGGHNVRLDFEWSAGNPGHLRMWKTRFAGGVPDASGTVLILDLSLPGAQTAVIDHVLAGVVSGQDAGTSGALYLDELSFRR